MSNLNPWIKQKLLGLFVKTNGFLSSPLFGGKGLLFCFHRILPKNEQSALFGGKGMAVSPEYLEGLIRTLKEKKYEFIGMDEVLLRIKNPDKTRKFVCLGFDDGYADNLIHGLPLFEKHGIPFIIYPSLNLLNGSMIRWWDILEEQILTNAWVKYQFPNKILELKTESLEEKTKAWWEIRSHILEWEGQFSRAEMLGLFCKDEAWNKAFTLSVAIPESSLIDLRKHPLLTIGSHTVHHLPLKKLPEDQARFELQESKRYLENLMDYEIKHLAYPYGSANECGEREFKLAQELGYHSGVTFMPGNLVGNNLNPFSLPRFAGGEMVDKERLHHILTGIRHFADNY